MNFEKFILFHLVVFVFQCPWTVNDHLLITSCKSAKYAKNATIKYESAIFITEAYFCNRFCSSIYQPVVKTDIEEPAQLFFNTKKYFTGNCLASQFVYVYVKII